MTSSIFNSNNYFFNIVAFPYFLVGALAVIEGFFVFIQNKRSKLHIAYLIGSSAAGIWLTGVGLVISSLNEGVALIWGRYFAWHGIIFVTPAVYLFSAIWEEEILSRRKKTIVFFNFLTAFTFYIVCIYSKYLIQGLWSYPHGFFPRAGSIEWIFIMWFYSVMGLSFHNFIKSYKNEKTPLIKKRHSMLVILAFSIAFFGSVEFLANYGIPVFPIACFPMLLFLSVIGYSIIYYKLLDIETVFHKTLAWLITNLALLVPFLLLGYFIKSWYAKLSFLPAVSFLGFISLIFLFLIKLLQPKIDHFFQRRQYNLDEIALRFTEDLVHLKGLNQLVQRIEDTIANTLYPQTINIFIYNENIKVYRLASTITSLNQVIEIRGEDQFLAWLNKNDKIVYRNFINIDPIYTPIRKNADDYFSLTEAIVVVPLILNEKLLGIINLGKKANLRRYTAFDFHFLTALKNQATIALSNSLLYENMEEQVKQRTKELVHVQKQLIQAEKMATVGTLAGGVAHEINNPLTAILTNVQMLLASHTVDDRLDRESLELIEEATKRCRTIVQKLMTYARRPLETTEISKVELLSVLKIVISFIGYQIEQENIKILTDIKENNYFVMGNQNELEQVFTNLILNAGDAVKQVKKSGSIYITFSRDRNWVKIDVKDEGGGIPKEIASKIFDPFFTTKDVGRGVGLGLSICQSIVEKHNGIITFKSVMGKGTTFTIKLPVAEESIKSVSI